MPSPSSAQPPSSAIATMPRLRTGVAASNAMAGKASKAVSCRYRCGSTSTVPTVNTHHCKAKRSERGSISPLLAWATATRVTTDITATLAVATGTGGGLVPEHGDDAVPAEHHVG